jgi:hypothetical protein
VLPKRRNREAISKYKGFRFESKTVGQFGNYFKEGLFAIIAKEDGLPVIAA